MTQAADPTRLTSRQRRIEEQRRKIEVARSQQRRQRMLWLAGIVIIVAVAVVGLILLMPHSAQASQMRQVKTFTGTHYPEGSAIPTDQWLRPPSSGPHWETVPQQFEYRMYDTSAPLPPGRYVHMLEHGAVVVLYRPDLCDASCVQTLGNFYDNAPRSNLVGIRHLAVTPYQDMDHAVAVVAWGAVDEMDQADGDRIMADFKSKVDASTAPERGAMQLQLRASTVVNAPPERVFELICSPERLPEWNVSVERARRAMPEQPVGIGSRAIMSGRLMGQSLESETEVTEFDPPRRFCTRAIRGPKLTTRFHLEEADIGTRLDIEVSGDVPGGAIGSRLAEGFLRRELTASLERLRTLSDQTIA